MRPEEEHLYPFNDSFQYFRTNFIERDGATNRLTNAFQQQRNNIFSCRENTK